MNNGTPLLRVCNLSKHFDVGRGKKVRAVNDVSFSVYPGETFGIVGESGCGKTTAGRVIVRLEKPTGGQVFFDSLDLYSLNKKELRQARRNIQMVFQDPFSSLDPRMAVGKTVSEPLAIHGIGDHKSRKKRAQELFEIVGLDPNYYSRYPHEFSGGQRQRIGIARALILNPQLVVCDEPVSALDVSVQSQILNLLRGLQREFGLTYIFIAHGLNVVKHISDRVAIMYLGRIMEILSSDELFTDSAHPYTQALLSAIPEPDPSHSHERIILAGDVPSPLSPPDGCVFHTRCRYCQDICRATPPQFIQNGERGIACHFPLNK